MAVNINFPESLQMSAKISAPASGLATRFRSDNASYSAGDIIRIEIPCSQPGATYLLPNDCYLSFDFNHVWSGGATNVRVDGSAYSFFRRARVIHGANVLCDTNHCGRLFNALRDITVPSSARSVDEIRLAVAPFATQLQTANGMAGLALTSGQTYDAAFPLPLPIVGTLQKSAVPLSLMASSLYIELEVAPMNQIFTNRVFSDADGAPPALALTSYSQSSFTISNIYYNAKLTTVEPAYNAALMSVYAGRPLMLPASTYLSEMKVIPAGASTINEKMAFSVSSCNGILWWLSNSNVANGVAYDTSGGLLDGTTHRQSGDLAEYYIALSGKNLQPVYCGRNGTILGLSNTFIKGANSVNQIGRIYDNMSTVDGMGILNLINYCSGVLDTAADAAATSKRFVGAYSLEKYDTSNRYSSGESLIGQDVRVVATMTTALTSNQNLYAYALAEIGFELIDGQLNLRS